MQMDTSKRMNWKWTGLVCSTFLLMAPLIFLFQNCSNEVKFDSIASKDEETLDCGEGCLERGSVELVAGTQPLPNLKMFFIVDNSYTMKANQLNLSQAFERMFDASNSASLTPFQATAMILNTGQRVYPYGSTTLNSMATDVLGFDLLAPNTVESFTASHRGTILSAKVAGDTIGYSPSFDANLKRWTFKAQPIVGVTPDGSDKVQFLSGFSKSAKQDPAEFKAEFQNRLALLDPERNPYKFPEVQDQESGLCAMARIMSKQYPLVQPGDLSSFVIISDEDDADLSGEKCIETYTESSGNEDLVKGSCETRRTTFTYNKRLVTPASCSAGFKTGYNVRYVYQNPNFVKTTVNYRRLQAETYTAPRTTITYDRIASQQYPRTKVTYAVRSCPVRDGVTITSQCTYPKTTATVWGNVISNCQTEALRLNSLAVTAAPHAPTCVAETPAARACTVTDSQCITTWTAPKPSTVVFGTFANGTDCTTKAAAISGAYVSATNPALCAPAPSQNGSGACPAGSIGCQSVKTFANATVDVDGDFSSASACDSRARTLAGAAVDSANPATCVRFTTTVTETRNSTVALDANLDLNGLSAVNATCSSAVLSKYLAANPTLPNNGSCLITGHTSASQAVADFSAGCTTAANLVCSTSGNLRRDCVATARAETITFPVQPTFSRDEDLACSDLCQKSVTGVCNLVSGFTPPADMTIAGYLAQVYGTTSCSASPRRLTTTRTFLDQPNALRNSLCAPSNGVPTYLVQDGTLYREKLLATEFVSGTVRTPSGYAPAANLKDFIVEQSSALFGTELKPSVSIFVRRPGDSTGDGGSIGQKYEEFATAMGAKKFSALSEDYSPALIELSQILKSKLQRSFSIPGMKAYQKIRKVWFRPVGIQDWVEVQTSNWSASGPTVTFPKEFDFNLGDSFKFDYY